MNRQLSTIDETNMTELEIGPDGRVYVFGASPEVLKILENLRVEDESLLERLELGRSGQAIPITVQVNRIPK
ncbi:MAG: hypothetical protein IT427_00170 [Pirellulales bacterium]|nr:hypothetical protein [Pirellulales bacterium]